MTQGAKAAPPPFWRGSTGFPGTTPHLGAHHAALARRHVRVLRSVHDRLCGPRPGEGRAAHRRARSASSPAPRCSSPRPSSGLFIGTFVLRLRRRPLRTAHDLHLFDAVVLRRDAGHGVPDHRPRRLPLAADRRHRHRRRARHHRHLSRRAGAEAHARPRLRLQPDACSSRWCRSSRFSPICWCRSSPLGLDGWRWVVLIGSAGALFVWFIRRAHAGKPALAASTMAGWTRPRRSRPRSRRKVPSRSQRHALADARRPCGREGRRRRAASPKSSSRPIAAAPSC